MNTINNAVTHTAEIKKFTSKNACRYCLSIRVIPRKCPYHSAVYFSKMWKKPVRTRFL